MLFCIINWICLILLISNEDAKISLELYCSIDLMVTGRCFEALFILGAAEYNFTFVPYFTRFYWSNNAHVKI